MRTLILAIVAAVAAVSCTVDASASVPIASVNLASAGDAPYISPEIDLDLPISAVAGDSQTYSSVAFDGTNYMVVWQDNRSGIGSDIYAARVTPTGEILDPTGIPVSVMPGDQGKPDIAFDGTQYIVVWEDSGDGAAKALKMMMGSTTENDVVYTTIGTDGTVGEEVRVTPIDTVSQQRPRIACTSAGLCLVVWYDKPGVGVSYNIYGRHVTASGVVDAADLALYTGDYDQRTPDVAAKTGLFAVVWEDGRNGESDIYGLTVTTEETPTISISFPISAASSSQQTQPAIATNGTDFMVAYEDTRSGSTDIYAAKIEADYDVTEYHVTSSIAEERTPSIAWDGTYYLISYADTRNGDSDIYGTRIGNDGGIYDISGFFICNTSAYQSDPSIVRGVSNYLVTWTDTRNGDDNEDIYGALVVTAGGTPAVTPAGGEPISLAANGQYHPQVSLLGGTYLIVWEDHRAADANIYAVRADSEGNILDGSPIVVTAEAGDQLKPVVSTAGTSWLVAWEDRAGADANIRARRISSGGGVYAIFNINADASDQQNPTITANGTDYLIAWEDYGAGNADIYAARVTGAGSLLDATPIEVSANPTAEFAPSCAYYDGNYLCLWSDRRGGVNNDIYGARLDGDGAIYDSIGRLIYDGTGEQLNPHVAAAEAGWFVSWENYDALTADVAGMFLDAGLDPLTADPAAYAEGQYAQSLPRAAFDGSGMVLAYQAVSLNGGYLVTSLHGAEVALDGTAATAFDIANSPNNAEEIDLALKTANGTGLMVYQTYDPAPEYRSYRVRAVQYYRGNSGDTCDADEQCGSGNCAGGYCCGTAACDAPGVCHVTTGYTCTDTGECVYPTAEVGAACGDQTEDACDLPNTCDGAQNCLDNRVEAGTTCRIAAGDCDTAEECDGTNTACPDDLKHGDETVCRNGIEVCNYPETCDGTNDDCPPDIKSIGPCRPAAGICDTAENCDGEGNDCPEDLFVGLGTECRVSAGACDPAEICTGDSAACPDDAKSTAVCRASAGDCDIIENCDGTNDDCPTDELVASGIECRLAAGTCDAVELCTGSSAVCPEDLKLTGVCRAATGTCDPAEDCGGVGDDCPADDFTATAGNSCDDGNPLTDPDTCDAAGACAGTAIEGLCNTGIAIDGLPYSDTGDLHGRPSSIDTYGVGCSAATATGGDVVYIIAAPTAGDTYQIIVTPAAGVDIFVQIQQGSCGAGNACIGSGDLFGEGQPETAEVIAGSDDPIYIVIEDKTEAGIENAGYTITVTKTEEPDADTIAQDDALTGDEDELLPDIEEPDQIVDEIASDEDGTADEETDADLVTDETPDVKTDKDTVKDADTKPDTDTEQPDDTITDDELDDGDLLLNDIDDHRIGAHPGCNCALIL